jgi:Mor family transcriptional regulator
VAAGVTDRLGSLGSTAIKLVVPWGTSFVRGLDSTGVQNCTDGTANKCLHSGMDGKAERDAKIHARRIEGRTLAAIGREFNLSRETIRQIARRMERKAKWRELSAFARLRNQ